jgi:hypothetical protein
VLRLMGLFSSSAARLARSVVDCRLSGSPVRATTSQATETIRALSRGGKDRLAASPAGILQGKLASGPALPPTADAVGVKVKPSAGLRVGDRGVFVEEQDQASALLPMCRSRAGAGEALRLGEEFIGKGWTMLWRRPRHETAPGGIRAVLFGNNALTIGGFPTSGNPTRICETDH